MNLVSMRSCMAVAVASPDCPSYVNIILNSLVFRAGLRNMHIPALALKVLWHVAPGLGMEPC